MYPTCCDGGDAFPHYLAKINVKRRITVSINELSIAFILGLHLSIANWCCYVSINAFRLSGDLVIFKTLSPVYTQGRIKPLGAHAKFLGEPFLSFLFSHPVSPAFFSGFSSVIIMPFFVLNLRSTTYSKKLIVLNLRSTTYSKKLIVAAKFYIQLPAFRSCKRVNNVTKMRIYCLARKENAGKRWIKALRFSDDKQW